MDSLKDILHSLLLRSSKSVPKFLEYLESYIRDHHWKNGLEFWSRLLHADLLTGEAISTPLRSQILELLCVSLGAGAVKGEPIDTRLHKAWKLLPDYLKSSPSMKELHNRVMKDISQTNTYEKNVSDVCVLSVIVGLYDMGMRIVHYSLI